MSTAIIGAGKTCPCAFLAFVAAIGVLGSCSSDTHRALRAKDAGGAEDSVIGYDSAPDARVVQDARPAIDAPDPELARCEREERFGLPGWKLNRDWSCACRLSDPEPDTDLPDWGSWERCPALGPRNVDCRVIVPPPEYVVGILGASVDVDESSGRIKLALSYLSPDRDHATRRTIFVFDADGPTLNAMINDCPLFEGCDVFLGGMNQGKLAVRVIGKDPSARLDFSLQAVLGGDAAGPLARLVYQWDPPPYDGWGLSAYVSSELLVIATRTFGRAAADWKTMQWREIWGQDPEGLMVAGTVVWGKSVFFGVSGGGLGGIMSWDPEHGLRPFWRRYGDRLENAKNFGTDGKDMVWTVGRRNEAKTNYIFDQYFLMTAPFTTDPAVVASTARVVREEHDGSFIPNAAYRVGCGYAAHKTNRGELVVTRLSDGAEWVVERLPPPDRDSWTFGKVLAVTCEEVFLPLWSKEGYYPDKNTSSIARIRIDSLGQPSFPVK